MLRQFFSTIFLCSCAVAVAAECPVDDFDDGDDAGWVQCGEWSERQTPMWDPSSGRYCLGLSAPLREPPPPPLTIAAEWTQASRDPIYANGCVRATFHSGTEQAGTWNTHFVLGLRADCRNGGYKAMLGPSLGRISIFRQLELMADSLAERFEEDTAYRAEFCAVGAALSLKVWPAAAPEPAEPQLTATNSRFTKGNIGVGVFVENDNRGPIVQGCFDDISFEPAPQCRGDLDCSGTVDAADLRYLTAAWGDAVPCYPRRTADVNGDCTVGFRDLVAVAKSWGSCPAAANR